MTRHHDSKPFTCPQCNGTRKVKYVPKSGLCVRCRPKPMRFVCPKCREPQAKIGPCLLCRPAVAAKARRAAAVRTNRAKSLTTEERVSAAAAAMTQDWRPSDLLPHLPGMILTDVVNAVWRMLDDGRVAVVSKAGGKNYYRVSLSGKAVA